MLCFFVLQHSLARQETKLDLAIERNVSTAEGHCTGFCVFRGFVCCRETKNKPLEDCIPPDKKHLPQMTSSLHVSYDYIPLDLDCFCCLIIM